MYPAAARPFVALGVVFVGFAVTFGILWYWIEFDPFDVRYWLALGNYVLENRSLPYPFKVAAPSGLAVAVALAIIPALIIRPTGYGDARRANRRDIAQSGLADGPGVVCGARGQKLLAFSGPRTAAVIAPAGAGKTVGVIFPTVVNLAADTSAIIHDPKAEILAATGAYRKTLGPIYRFCPTDPTSDPWNALDDRDLPAEFGDLQSYIDMVNAVLFPGDKGGAEDHWTLTAAAAAKAATLFNIMLARQEGRSTSFAEVYSWLATAGRDHELQEGERDAIGAWLTDQATAAQNAGWPAAISDGLFVLAQKDYRERASVISTALARLEMFSNENVAKSTSRSAFSFKDIREGPAPVTIYLHLPENVRKSMARLAGLFVQCLANHVLSYSEAQTRQLKKVCFVLDELPAFPPIEAIEAIPARGRGLGVWGVYAAQSYSQIYAAFGRERGKVITELFTYLVILQLNSRETQEEMSAVIGDFTRKRTSASYSGPMGKSIIGREGQQESLEGARLVRAEELGNLKIGEAIISVQGFKTRPIYCQTAYNVRRIRNRLTLH